jgi:PAS domain S-box-containing protein
VTLDDAFVFNAPAARNRNCAHAYAPAELIGRPLSEFVPTDEMPMHEGMLQRKMEGEQGTRYEMHILAKDSRRLTLEINSQLIHDQEGKPTGIHSIARDVTDRKVAEERQALLVREVQHRTKNLLAVMQSIVSSTIKNSRDLKSADATITGRLQALARAQQFMSTSESGRSIVPIDELVPSELTAFGDRITATGPAVMAGSSFAQMLAVVIHELATNATKYGALSVPAGRVSIRWVVHNDEFSLSWIERGGPATTTPASSGFGSQLIRAALPGTPRVSYSQEGFEYEVVVPIEEVMKS